MACSTHIGDANGPMQQYAMTSSDTGHVDQDGIGEGTDQENDSTGTFLVDALHLNLVISHMMSHIMYDEFRGMVSMSSTESLNRRLRRAIAQLGQHQSGFEDEDEDEELELVD